MRAVLFVDQPLVQRSLGQQLSSLGFDVILPVTLDEARRSLLGSLHAPDLLVMNFHGADRGCLELLDVISETRPKTPVVLIAEAMDSVLPIDGVAVLPPSAFGGFSLSVRRLCDLKVRGWPLVEHGKAISAW